MNTFGIYFSDLTPDAQERFLAAQGLHSAAEGNYVIPICECEEKEDN